MGGKKSLQTSNLLKYTLYIPIKESSNTDDKFKLCKNMNFKWAPADLQSISSMVDSYPNSLFLIGARLHADRNILLMTLDPRLTYWVLSNPPCLWSMLLLVCQSLYIYSESDCKIRWKQEAKGRNIGKTHSETDTSNYLFWFCQDQKISAWTLTTHLKRKQNLHCHCCSAQQTIQWVIIKTKTKTIIKSWHYS